MMGRRMLRSVVAVTALALVLGASDVPRARAQNIDYRAPSGGGAGGGAPATQPATGGAYGSFIALPGSSTTGATSPDGTTWTSRTVVNIGGYTSVAWNGTVYCAVGSSQTAASSPDGVTWTSRTLPSNQEWHIAWNGTVFSALAHSNNVAATSPDCITWTSRTGPNDTPKTNVWNGSIFVATTDSNATFSYTSPDGITWTQQSFGQGGSWNTLAWSGKTFCSLKDGSNNTATSLNGTAWTFNTGVLPGGAGLFWESLVWGDGPGLFVAANDAGTIITSPDCVTWTSRTNPGSAWGHTSPIGNALTWNGKVFVILAKSGNVGAVSPDGLIWTATTTPVAGWFLAGTNYTPLVASTGSVSLTGTVTANSVVTNYLFVANPTSVTSASEHDFSVYNSANLASATALGETTVTNGSTVTTGSKIVTDIAGVGAGNFVAMLCTDGTTCASANQRLTCTQACTAAAGTRTACTVQNGGTIVAGTVVTWSVTTACATTDPGTNINAHFTTP